MDGYGEGGKEGERERDRWWQVVAAYKASRGHLHAPNKQFNSIQIIHHSIKSRLIQLSMFECLLPCKIALSTGYCTQRDERAEQ